MKEKTTVFGIVDICMAVKVIVDGKEVKIQQYTRDHVHGMIPELKKDRT